MRDAIAAAREVFAAKGFRGATMGDIARNAGVSKNSLYLWYADKSSLLRACLIEGASDVQVPKFDRRVDPEEALIELARTLLMHYCSKLPYEIAALMLREGRDFPEIADAALESRKVLMKPVTELLQTRGMNLQQAELHSKMFSFMLFDCVEEAILTGRKAPGAAENARSAVFVARLFWRGVSGLDDADS